MNSLNLLPSEASHSESDGENKAFDNLLKGEEDFKIQKEFYCFTEPVSKPFKVKKNKIKQSDRINNNLRFMGDSSRYSNSRVPSHFIESPSTIRVRQDSVDSSDSKYDIAMATSQYERDFWTPSLFRKSRISDAEEAVPADEGSFCSEDESSMTRISRVIQSSLSNLSIEKYREKHWFCYSCRQPRDMCRCSCSVC